MLIEYWICLLISLICIDWKNLISLRNIFLVYVTLTFSFTASSLYPEAKNIAYDGILYILSFILGYYFIKILPYSISNRALTNRCEETKNVILLRRLIYSLCSFKLLLVIYDIYNYGLVEFFSGQPLADQILRFGEGYGEQSLIGGLTIIVNTLTTSALVGAAILYYKGEILSRNRVNYLPLIVPFLILPLVSLQRKDFAVGIIFLLGLKLFEFKFILKRIPRKFVLLIAISFLILTISGVGIGILRENRVDSVNRPDSITTRIFNVARGEFTTIAFYNDVKENIDLLRYQYGETLFLPALLKFIPRSWFPQKPPNSAAYLMEILYPDSFAAGYSLAPSIFGDLYLNFGLFGCMIGIFGFGAVSGFYDKAFIRLSIHALPGAAIFLFFYYKLLRQSLSDSAIELMITVLVLFLLRQILSSRKNLQEANKQRWSRA
jgi:oligosaccharide repeat unit polymerase